MRGVALLILLAASAAFPVAATPAAPPVCKVPTLTGRTTAAAKAALKRAGCPASALKTATACAAKAKKGLVLDQKPAARAGLKKGQKIAVHVGIDCTPPPLPPPPPPAANFLGDFSGTYTGSLLGTQGCPDIPISGIALVEITQTGTMTYDLSFELDDAHVITNDECKEFGRGPSYGDVLASSSGASLNGAGFTASISGNTLTGTFQARSGQITFTVTRSS